MGDFYVTYKVRGISLHQKAGPYPSRAKAQLHRDDISGFEMVYDVEVVEPAEEEPKRAIDRLLESE